MASDALTQVDQDFREARVRVSAPPTRFYLNLTEHCSLRCQHCITRAPERTQDGSARHMGEDVVAALTPHLRHAHYLGFTHAGEPLQAPALVPVLRALQVERGGQPTVVHTLTNGAGLTAQRMTRLVELGVRSFSVSVDGMSRDTHDVLRLGSRIDQLLPRLRELAVMRRTTFPDVRLGVAWTVTAANLREVPALIGFAAEVGLSWVKLEEVYPINPSAQRLAAIRAEDLGTALADADALAAALGVPLLFHLNQPPFLTCQLRPGSAEERFSRLDDLCNRMTINPCRMPYEVCCVEPNGDVRPMSFHHPVAGNLLVTDLVELWNSRFFLEERARARAARVCQPGAVICPADGGPERW